MAPVTRREWLKAGAAGLGAAALAPTASAGRSDRLYSFHHDHVIGTSLDLWVAAPDGTAAAAAERAVVAEVERLRLVLSAYDSASELSRLNRSGGPFRISPDLAGVLGAYDRWQRATGGVVNARLGALTRAWKMAELEGTPPPAAELERLVADIATPGWHLIPGSRTAHRTSDQPLDLNALGKAYIIDRAAAVAREAAPAVTGLLLDVGGDVAARGSHPGGSGWAVGVQDPLNPYDNAAPLAGLRLTNRAVAGSGGYQRFFTVDGRRYSHVLDSRTGRPAAGVAGTTVVAPDAVTANALATTLCVLSPADGLRLVAAVPGAECLIVGDDGTQFRSPGLELVPAVLVSLPARIDGKAPADEKAARAGPPWPEGYQMTVAVELPKLDAARRYRRPYVAVWVDDAAGKPIRTLSVWGNAPKYLKDLTDWWKIGRGDADLVKAVVRATRGPGKYSLAWDGKDDKGRAVPQGTYTVRVEVHREHGKHVRQSGAIACRDAAAVVKLPKNDETAETVIEYGGSKSP